jgi:pyruvate dehydrogenase E2 component (dihydrolipoamide acetyltransferase)
MPALSPTMEEGKIARWTVREGDRITSGTVIAEIETDKATMEFEAVDEGRVARLLVAEGTEGVKVNTPIALLAEEGESLPSVPAAGAAPRPSPTDAAAQPPADERSGNAPAVAPSHTAAASATRVFASPLARRMAAEAGLDLASLKGSGPHGRIVKADVEAGAAARSGAGAVPVGTPIPSPPVPPPELPPGPAPVVPAGPAAPDGVSRLYQGREYTEVPLDGMRKVIAARLTEAKQTIPHFYLRRDISLDALLVLRGDLNRSLEKRGVKLSVNDFIIKAAALALQQVPDCNAVWAGDRILKFRRSDVAVAVAVTGGLLTPVIRDADQKSLSRLSAEMKDLAARARDRKLAPHEYQGGSFAISNLGMFGIESFDAVINPPHGSILAVGAGLRRPVVGGDGAIAAATMMTVTLSVDHRVIDGALGADFLGALKSLIEEPLALLA